MRQFTNVVDRVDLGLHYVAGAGLVVMMLATMTDIIVRAMGYPLVGVIEIVSFCGAIVIGLAIPHSTSRKVHIAVDFLTDRLTAKGRARLAVVTRLLGIALFLFASYNFVLYSLDLWRAKEVSGSLRIPFYPLTMGLAFSCLMQALTLVCQLLALLGGGNQDG
ncbi:MAG: TRAP transporter small permease [Desulfarculus sp.]|nr:TRAP transporter small permease [Desulfarculus sp.]